VADIVAAAGDGVTAGALQSDAHCVLARAIFSAPSSLEGREFVKAVNGVLCAAALAKTDAICAAQAQILKSYVYSGLT
jgi:hypothetical protein